MDTQGTASGTERTTAKRQGRKQTDEKETKGSKSKILLTPLQENDQAVVWTTCISKACMERHVPDSYWSCAGLLERALLPGPGALLRARFGLPDWLI